MILYKDSLGLTGRFQSGTRLATIKRMMKIHGHSVRINKDGNRETFREIKTGLEFTITK